MTIGNLSKEDVFHSSKEKELKVVDFEEVNKKFFQGININKYVSSSWFIINNTKINLSIIDKGHPELTVSPGSALDTDDTLTILMRRHKPDSATMLSCEDNDDGNMNKWNWRSSYEVNAVATTASSATSTTYYASVTYTEEEILTTPILNRALGLLIQPASSKQLHEFPVGRHSGVFSMDDIIGNNFVHVSHILDNAKQYFFKNAVGVVEEIKPTAVKRLPSGIYIKSGQTDTETFIKLTEDQITLAGLQPTWQEATDYCVISNASQEELTGKLQELENTYTDYKRDWDAKLETLKLQNQRELKQMELEFKEKDYALSLERSESKGKYEDRSYDRKDSSEMLKVIGVLGVGILALSNIFK